MERKKRNEWILIAGLLILSATSFAAMRPAHPEPAAKVQISVDGTVIRELPLSQDADLTLESQNGGTNHLVIKDGKASVTEASCPDKICVRQGEVSESGQTIVCLPNKVVITIQ